MFPNMTRVLPTPRMFRWGHITWKRIIYFLNVRGEVYISTQKFVLTRPLYYWSSMSRLWCFFHQQESVLPMACPPRLIHKPHKRHSEAQHLSSTLQVHFLLFMCNLSWVCYWWDLPAQLAICTYILRTNPWAFMAAWLQFACLSYHFQVKLLIID